MTSRIQYRQHFNRVIGYALKRTKGPELIASTLAATEAQGMITEMEALRARSSRCKQPVAHFVLSIKEGERLTDGQWNEAASRTAEAFGMQQFFAVRHNDTGCDHLHLIGNRVRCDGKAWSTSNDRFRMRSLCQELEEDFRITATPSQSRRSRINKDEIEKAERLFKQGAQGTATPARLLLAEEVKATLAVSRSAQDFEEQLKGKNISTRWRHGRDGLPIGVSFARGQAAISGRNAGISCRTILIHFNEGSHEQNRSFTRPGGGSRLDPTAGQGDRCATPGGFAEADPVDSGTDFTDSATGRDSTGKRRSHSGAPDILTGTAHTSAQLMTATLHQFVREIDEADASDGRRGHPRAPEAHPARTLRRILRTPRKQTRRPSR